jgi:hypothetical protein
MSKRNGLYVGLVGLVMAMLCLAPLFLLREWHPEGEDGLTVANLGLVSLALGAVFGLIVMAVGLVLFGVLAWTKQASKPYRHAAAIYSGPPITNQGSGRLSDIARNRGDQS